MIIRLHCHHNLCHHHFRIIDLSSSTAVTGKVEYSEQLHNLLIQTILETSLSPQSRDRLGLTAIDSRSIIWAGIAMAAI